MSAPPRGRRVLVVEHEADAGLDLMAGPLGRLIEVVRPYLGEPLPTLSGDGIGKRPGDGGAAAKGQEGQRHHIVEYAGLVVLGGEMGAWDDDVAPWLPATRQLLAEAVRQALPTLGICLGAQLLAAACGGVVERGSAGLELGLVPVTPLPAVHTDPFFRRVALELGKDSRRPASEQEAWQVSQYHYDVIDQLPPDGELIVTGPLYRLQGFRVGAAAWAVQYHPEVSTAGFTRWVTTAQHSGELSGDVEQVLAAIQAAEATQLALAHAHAAAFLDVVNSLEAPATDG